VKVAVVTNILTPYRLPLFAALRARVDNLRVFVMAEREENRDWNLPDAAFEWQVLPGWHLQLPSRAVALHVNRGVGSALARFEPDVVLSGGFGPANLAAWLYCRRRRCAFINWGELSHVDLTGVGPLKRALRRLLTAGADGAIASSSTARDVFIRFGARPERVLTAVMPIDVEHFHAGACSARSARGASAYSAPVLVNVGRVVESKGYRELFGMYAQILRSHPQATLLIVGDGPDRAAYEAHARDSGWRNVHFLGFRQSEDVAKVLALADVFVFPTLADPFGAVLSEAMAAELPVVASIHAAATLDLVEDGVTGFRIEPRDVASSAAVIRRVLELSEAERAAFGARAYIRVKQFDIATTAETMVGFLQGAVSARPTARRGMLSPFEANGPDDVI
jgi:glycosyltransferase involved in cell wall biosynthesis